MTPRHRPGFLLIELLIALGLLSILLLIAGRLFFSSMGVLRTNGIAQEQDTRFQVATALLRSDIASSTDVRVESPRVVRVTTTAHLDVRWEVAGSELSRTGLATRQRWRVGGAVSFGREGDLVLLCPGTAGDINAPAALPMVVEGRLLDHRSHP